MEQMLARYHLWVFENFQVESVETLREWVIQESQFQPLAHVEGLTRGEGHPDHSNRPRAFFSEDNTVPPNVSNNHAPFTEIIIGLIVQQDGCLPSVGFNKTAEVCIEK